MIQRLRRRHRLMIPSVALVSIPLVVVGLLTRQPDPVQAELPEILRGLTAPTGAPDLDIEVGFASLAAHARVWQAEADGEGPILELTPSVDPRRPDVLAYWTGAEDAARPGPEAQLLGRLAGTRSRTFQLPAEASTGTGSLLLFSLAHDDVVDHAAWPLIAGDA